MHLSPLLSQIPVNWGKGKKKKKNSHGPIRTEKKTRGKQKNRPFRKEKDSQVVAHLEDLGKLPWGRGVRRGGGRKKGCLELGDTYKKPLQFNHKI